MSEAEEPASKSITVGDPWPDRDPLSPRRRYEAMYLARGQVTHLVQALADLNNFPYTPALCGMEPEWPDLWRGHGSQDEYDEAAARPLCTRCLARDPKRQEWRARCAEIAGNANLSMPTGDVQEPRARENTPGDHACQKCGAQPRPLRHRPECSR